jgi:3',5'-cyclic AMP phosphodiesterase CpdA
MMISLLYTGETECNSPFEVNKMANGRMRHVIHDLNRRELDFIIHLGDLLHPVPAIPHLYERAAQCFKDQVADLRHKLYVVPGNHDVGDKPLEWGPAGVVLEEFLTLWHKHFGPNYQSFRHGGCRFVLMDAQIINSGLQAEKDQRVWLESELASASDAGERILLNIHFPSVSHLCGRG